MQRVYSCGIDCSHCPHLVPDEEVYYGHRMTLGPDYCELGHHVTLPGVYDEEPQVILAHENTP